MTKTERQPTSSCWDQVVAAVGGGEYISNAQEPKVRSSNGPSRIFESYVGYYLSNPRASRRVVVEDMVLEGKNMY
jgi:hypothetical protein